MNNSDKNGTSILSVSLDELWKTSPLFRVGAVVLVIVLIGIVWGLNTPVSYRNQAVSNPASGTYQEVVTFSGSGSKRSEPFAITGGRFKIVYDCSANYCGGYLYTGNGEMSDVFLNSPGPIQDETVIYGNGSYYIQSNATGDFTMTVYDYR